MSLPDPSWAQKLPPGPHRHPLSAAPSHCSAGPVPPCPLLPAFHKRKAARHSLSGDWITFLHMEISFPRIRSPVPARRLASVVVNLPLGIFGAAECHGRWWIEGGAGSSHQPLGKSSKPMARSPRAVLPGTSGGVLGAHLSSSPHLSQLSWELRAPGAGGWNCLVTQGRMLPCPSPTSNWTPILSGWDSQSNGHFQGVAKEGRINGAKYPFRRYGERGGLCWEMAGRNPDRDAGWSGGRAGGMCVVGCAADTGGQLMKRRTLGPVSTVSLGCICSLETVSKFKLPNSVSFPLPLPPHAIPISSFHSSLPHPPESPAPPYRATPALWEYSPHGPSWRRVAEGT